MRTLHTQPKPAENFVQFVDSTDPYANLRTFIHAVMTSVIPIVSTRLQNSAP